MQLNPDLGTRVTLLLSKETPLNKKKFYEHVSDVLIKSVNHLLENLPLENKLIKAAASFQPGKHQIASTPKMMVRLARMVGKALGKEQISKIFQVKSGTTLDGLCDVINLEANQYQTEVIDPSLALVDQNDEKKSNREQKTYWKKAYEIAGIECQKNEEIENSYRRIDEYWLKVLPYLDYFLKIVYII